MHSDERHSLFNPRDFIPTSLIWGFWAAGVMASVNLTRNEQPQKGRRMLLLSIAAQIVLLAGFAVLKGLLGDMNQSGPSASGDSFPVLPRMPFSSVVDMVLIAINGLVGLYMYRTQQRMYKEWVARYPSANTISPYVASWVSLLAILATLMVVGFVGFFYFSK